MDNHEEEKETLIAQSSAEGATLTDVLAACPFCGETPAHLGWPSIAFEIAHTPDCWIGGSQIIRSGHEKRRWNTRVANLNSTTPPVA